MASRKTFLYGLGSGLIVGSLLMQLGSIGESASSQLNGEALEAAAAANGYVLKDAQLSWYHDEQVRRMVDDAVAEAVAKLPDQAPNEGSGDKLSGESAAEGNKVYAFTIASGTELTTVAKLLYELGLVSDYNGFLLEMEERGLAGKIQAKHYRFDGVPTLEELIQALTTR